MEELVEALSQAREAEVQELVRLQKALVRATGLDYVALYTPEEISNFRRRDGTIVLALLAFGVLCGLGGWLTFFGLVSAFFFGLTASSVVAIIHTLNTSPGLGGDLHKQVHEVPVQDRRRLVERTLLEEASTQLPADELLRVLEKPSNKAPNKSIYESNMSATRSPYTILCSNHPYPPSTPSVRKKKC